MKLTKQQQLGSVEQWQEIKRDITENYCDYSERLNNIIDLSVDNKASHWNNPRNYSIRYDYMFEGTSIQTISLRHRPHYAVPITNRQEMKEYLEEHEEFYSRLATHEDELSALIFKTMRLELDIYFNPRDEQRYANYYENHDERIYLCYDAVGKHCGNFAEGFFPHLMVEFGTKQEMLDFCDEQISFLEHDWNKTLYATIGAVSVQTKEEYNPHVLKAYCLENKLKMDAFTHNNKVIIAYPAEAWSKIYDIEINEKNRCFITDKSRISLAE